MSELPGRWLAGYLFRQSSTNRGAATDGADGGVSPRLGGSLAVLIVVTAVAIANSPPTGDVPTGTLAGVSVVVEPVPAIGGAVSPGSSVPAGSPMLSP